MKVKVQICFKKFTSADGWLSTFYAVDTLHWNGNIITVMKFLSLVSLEVVIWLITFGVINMKILSNISISECQIIAIMCQWLWSTFVQVMAWCLTAPSQYLNQCWLNHRGLISLTQIKFNSSMDKLLHPFKSVGWNCWWSLGMDKYFHPMPWCLWLLIHAGVKVQPS